MEGIAEKELRLLRAEGKDDQANILEQLIEERKNLKIAGTFAYDPTKHELVITREKITVKYK